MIAPTELAWAAGFLDGEGSFNFIRSSGARGQLKIQATQVDRRPLDRLQRVLGGHIRGPYSQPDNGWRSGHRPRWDWYLTTRSDFIAALEALRPYLTGPKAEQADVAVLQARLAGFLEKEVA